MTKRYRDFDAAFAENQKEPVTLKIFGKVEELPAAMPAIVILKLMRMQKEYGELGVVPEQELFDMATSIFGQGRLDEWCNKGLDIDQLGALLKWTMEQYRGGGNNEEGNEQLEAEK